MTTYEAVIGLECHVELSTATKMFCSCANAFGAPPNSNTCPVCLGHPGTLPVPNREAIARIIKIGLALDSTIAPHSLFHRKNYFYPDMPKNYQISQYDLPICVGGHLDVELPDASTKRVGITRVHMEEDTGKSTHGGGSGRIHDATYAAIDFNRAGVPLVECVSEPDMRSPEEAAAYLRELRSTLEVLDVSDVKMEEGSLRCDANVSVRPAGTEALGTKVEVKNMNSIRSLERALIYEIERQTTTLEAGVVIVQETRHWDEDSGATSSMRSKEEAFDYRYFPEPDIPAMEPSNAWIEEIRATIPELPRGRRHRYREGGDLSEEHIKVLVGSRVLGESFDRLAAAGLGVEQKLLANFITQEVAARVNDGTLPTGEVLSHVEGFGRIVQLAQADDISWSAAKDVLDTYLQTGEAVDATVDRLGLRQVSDAAALGALADEVIAENPEVAQKFRDGKENVIGFLVGQLMQKASGAANPKIAQQLLRERLGG